MWAEIQEGGGEEVKKNKKERKKLAKTITINYIKHSP